MFSKSEVHSGSGLDRVLSSKALLAAVILVAVVTFCLGPAGTRYDISGLVTGIARKAGHVGSPGVGTPLLLAIPELTSTLGD